MTLAQCHTECLGEVLGKAAQADQAVSDFFLKFCVKRTGRQNRTVAISPPPPPRWSDGTPPHPIPHNLHKSSYIFQNIPYLPKLNLVVLTICYPHPLLQIHSSTLDLYIETPPVRSPNLPLYISCIFIK